jgi:hypothetical protein
VTISYFVFVGAFILALGAFWVQRAINTIPELESVSKTINISGDTKMTIDMMREMFLWCSIINIVLLLLSFVLFWLGHDWIYRVHTKWYKLSEETFDAIWYSIMAFFKICILLFNVVPYLALLIIG